MVRTRDDLPLRLWRVDVPWACFGLLSTDLVVVEAAPIAAWTIGKTIEQVGRYFIRKGGTVSELRRSPQGQLFSREHRLRADGTVLQFVRAL